MPHSPALAQRAQPGQPPGKAPNPLLEAVTLGGNSQGEQMPQGPSWLGDTAGGVLGGGY